MLIIKGLNVFNLLRCLNCFECSVDWDSWVGRATMFGFSRLG